MRWIALCVAAAALAGCVKTITGPDGKPAYATRCVGAKCFEVAAEKCPNGYNIFSDTPVVVGSGGFITTQRDIAFSCK